MTVNLKNFILQEEIKSSHAAKYIDYQENFHDEILEDLIEDLSKEWKKNVLIRAKKNIPNEEYVKDILLKNSNPFLGIEFSNKEILVGNGRFSRPKSSLISVKISHAYDSITRKSLIKKFLLDAENIFEKIIQKNENAFNIKFLSGKQKTLFHISKTDNSIKIQFKTHDKNSSKELIKTIFMVSVEHGKEGSKSKNYDRIYFLDYTK